MADQERETVVVEDNREPRSSYSWVIALVVVLAIILTFFLMGGFSLFNGSGSQTQNDSVNVEPAN